MIKGILRVIRTLVITATFSSTCVAAESSEDVAKLDPLVTVGTKLERPVADVAASVTVIPEERIRHEIVQDMFDVVRYLPGVSVEGAGTRFGANGFQIRGIGGNRVVFEIDGVPVSEQFDIGNFSNADRDFIEPELIKRVEILYGPASTLYGSDAIAGVIAITTRDPDDLLRLSDGRWYASLKGAYNSDDDSFVAATTAAFGGERFGVLATYARREGGEQDNMANGVPDDPQDFTRQNLLTRFTYDPGITDRLRITAQASDEEVQTDIRSLLGVGRFATTTRLTGNDTQEQEKLIVDYSLQRDGAWFSRAVLRGFLQDTRVRQDTVQERQLATPAVRQERRFSFEQDTFGLEVNFEASLVSGSTSHVIGYGAEFIGAEISEQRDAIQIDLASGAVTNVVLGERFPLRDFPVSETEELGVYFQDEITFADQRWTLIPGLRYDRYELSVRPDFVFLADNPATVPVELDDDAVSPKLAAIYRVNEAMDFYAQYQRGFRAPPFEDVNIGLDIPLFLIRAIPNPDLKSETSDGIELGIRFEKPRTRLEAGIFYNEFEDFIETKVNLGFDPVAGAVLFQSQNIAEAETFGVDLRAEQLLADLDAGRLTLNGALNWTHGENEVSGEGLNSIDPPEAVAGLRFDAAGDRYYLELKGNFVRGKNSLDDPNQTLFRTPGYAVFDLLAGWRIRPDTELTAGIFNLADRKYWRWSEVRGLDAGDPVVEVLSRPGTNVSVSVLHRF